MKKQVGGVYASRNGRCAAIGLLAGMLAPTTAWAYIGPGAGLTAIGSLVAIVIAVLIALVGLVWFPLRMVMKHLRGKKSRPEAEFEMAPSQDVSATSKTEAG